MALLSREALRALWAAEQARFTAEHPKSLELARRSQAHFLYGVPMHWMRDWPMPSPLFVASAGGARLRCVDDLSYSDFCLGDTGAMFGHSPAPVAQAIAAQASQGLTAMLPSEQSAELGAQLQAIFRLPKWQICLSASDANRFVVRWARAITRRPKVLVFDGCYHGTVDDTLVDMPGQCGRHEEASAVTRPSLLGQVHDLALGAVVVPFNDLDALERALSQGDVAGVLAEPALTNCGLVLPQDGYWAAAQALCRAAGSLLIMDETHTLSTGLGGWCGVNSFTPDLLVVGKAIAGGLPCAVYGFSEEVALRMRAAKASVPEGHSGIGTTLSANLLSVAALRATLAHLMTPEVYTAMAEGATRLEQGLLTCFANAGVPWSVARLGARMEIQFAERPPQSATAAREAMDHALESALHLYLLNRGSLVTPFHNMLLVSPATEAVQVDELLGAIKTFIKLTCGQS